MKTIVLLGVVALLLLFLNWRREHMDDAPGFQDPQSSGWTMNQWQPDPADLIQVKKKAADKATVRIAGRNTLQNAINCAINAAGGSPQTAFNGFNGSAIVQLINGATNPADFLTGTCTPPPAELTDNLSLAMKCANDLSKQQDVKTLYAGLYPADAYLQRTECLGYSAPARNP